MSAPIDAAARRCAERSAFRGPHGRTSSQSSGVVVHQSARLHERKKQDRSRRDISIVIAFRQQPEDPHQGCRSQSARYCKRLECPASRSTSAEEHVRSLNLAGRSLSRAHDDDDHYHHLYGPHRPHSGSRYSRYFLPLQVLVAHPFIS